VIVTKCFGEYSVRLFAALAWLCGSMIFSTACSAPRQKQVKDLTREELLDAFATETDDQRRAAVVRQLGTGKDRLAVEVLIMALKDHSEPIQLAAAVALGQSGAKEAAAPLWEASNDPVKGPNVRLTSAISLSRLGDARAIEPLVRAVPNGDAFAALMAFGQSAIPAVVDSLRSSETRAGAMAVLIAFGKPAVDPLLEVMRKDDNKNARWTALRVLSEIEDERAAAGIDEALKQPEAEVTLAASRYLIRRGRASDQPRLISALKEVGNSEMAQDFATSGDPALKAAAEEWAAKRGSVLSLRSSTLPPVFWGGIDPSVRDVAVYHFDGSLTSTTGGDALESKGVSFTPGKWGEAVSVGKGGTLKYPVAGNLTFDIGSIEMWISPKLDGADPIFKKYNHALLLYPAPDGDQFLLSSSTLGGFYCGSVVAHKFAGAGGGSITDWKPGSWHHLAFTYSSGRSRQRFYIDGAMVSETRGAMPPPKGGAATFTVGCDPYGNWTGFDLDELVLSTGEKGADWIQRDASRKGPK
jgi:HEAT repeat protein